jgi:hypothetical protein
MSWTSSADAPFFLWLVILPRLERWLIKLGDRMTESLRMSGSDQPTGWRSLVSIATPLTVASAAFAFVSGATYRDVLLAYYGLEGSMINEPVQVTMARGYLAFIVGGTVLLVVHLIALIAGFSTSNVVLFKPKAADRIGDFLIRKNIRAKYFFMASAGIMLVIGGAATGTICAILRYDEISRATSNNCHNCILYNTKRGKVSGVPVIGDSQILIISTRQGAVRVENSEIKALRRYVKPTPISKLLM